MEEEKKPEQKSVIGCILLCLSFMCLLIAFASPYWVESFEQFHGRFVKVGLWEVCFNDYTFYKDYSGKRFLGCWYIFGPEIRPIWEWISPPWFIVCQVAVSFSLLLQGLVAIAMILYLFRLFPSHMKSMILLVSSIGSLIACLVLFAELILFGVMKEDRDWVPRPDMNYLSWSYGFASVSFLFVAGAAFMLWSSSQIVGKRNDAYDTEYNRPARNY